MPATTEFLAVDWLTNGFGSVPSPGAPRTVDRRALVLRAYADALRSDRTAVAVRVGTDLISSGGPLECVLVIAGPDGRVALYAGWARADEHPANRRAALYAMRGLVTYPEMIAALFGRWW